MSANYDLFRKAALEGKQVTFDYKGYRREACTHVVGLKHGLEKVLLFQFAGGSSSGLPPTGEWRCVFVSEVENLQLRVGPWFSRDSHKRPQTCVDEIDVEVQVSPDGTATPYLKKAYS